MKGLPQSHYGPGLIDLQVNGYAGFSFNGDPAGWTAQQFHHVRSAMARRGVVAALPTFITDDAALMIARARKYAEVISGDAALAAFFPALHIEGPFISPVEGPRGAHPKFYCELPEALGDLIDRLRQASGNRVAIVTLAPELPGALEMIRKHAAAGICMAIGHTQASASTLDEAVAAGARLSTHLGNGSHALLPRLDNYVQHQLADDRLLATFIADGCHMPLTTLKNFIRAKTPQRSILITDAVAAAEMPPGVYELGGEQVELNLDGRVAKPGAPNLAGSALTLDRAVIGTHLHCDVTFEQAWAMASTIPASLLGLPAPSNVTVRITEKGFISQYK